MNSHIYIFSSLFSGYRVHRQEFYHLFLAFFGPPRSSRLLPLTEAQKKDLFSTDDFSILPFVPPPPRTDRSCPSARTSPFRGNHLPHHLKNPPSSLKNCVCVGTLQFYNHDFRLGWRTRPPKDARVSKLFQAPALFSFSFRMSFASPKHLFRMKARIR